jgi:hypothetical protein
MANKGGGVFIRVSLLLSKTCFNKNKKKTVKDTKKKGRLEKLSSKGQFQFFPTLQLVDF